MPDAAVPILGFAVNLLVAVAAYRVAGGVSGSPQAGLRLTKTLVWLLTASAVVVLAVELAGMARLLDRPVAVFAIAGGIGFVLFWLASRGRRRAPERERGSSTTARAPRAGWPEGVAASGLAFLLLAWIPLICDRLWLPPVAWDALTYHLPFAVGWLQGGDLATPVPITGDPAHSYYPLAGQMLLYWNLITTGTDRWTVLSQIPFLIGTACGVALIATHCGASRRVAAMAALAWAGTPIALRSSVEVMVDLAPAAYFVGALALAEAGRRRGSAVLGLAAWVSLGLLVGTKYSGVILALAALPFVLAAPFGRGSLISPRRASATAAIGGAALALGLGGYAYVRNLVSGGNPFLPLEITLGPWTIFPGPATASEYFGASAARLGWGALLLSRRSILEMGILFIPLLMGLVLALRSGGHGGAASSHRRLIAAVAVAAFVLSFIFLPFREHRYFLPATAAAWAAVAAAAEEFRLAPWFERGVAAALACQVPVTLFYWLKELWVLGWSAPRSVAVFLAASVPLGLIVMARRGSPPVVGGWRNRPAHTLALGGAVGVLLLAATLTTRSYEARRFERWARFWSTRYEWEDLKRPREDYRDMAGAWSWIAARTRSNAAVIAYSGTNLPYPLTGYGRRNRVVVVSRNGRATTPVYRWGNLPVDPTDAPSAESWMRNVIRLGVEYLCVVRLYPSGGGTGRFPIEDGWAQAAPERFALRWATPWARIYGVRSP